MKIEQRIKYTFVRAFIVVFVVSAFIICSITAYVMSRQTYKLLQTASAAKTELLRSYLIGQSEIVITLSGASIFRDLLNESSTSAQYATIQKKVEDKINRTMKLDKNMDEICLVNPEGKILASSTAKRKNIDISSNLFFIEGKNKTYIRDVYFSDVANKLAWGISSQIREDNTGKLIGVIIVRFKVAPLFNLSQSPSNLGNSAETFIVNSKLILLSTSRYLTHLDILSKKINTENANTCFKTQEKQNVSRQIFINQYMPAVKVYKDYRNILILGTHSYIPEANWCLLTKVDLFEVYVPLFGIVIVFLGTVILGSYIFFVLSSVLSKKITAPIEELYAGVQAIQKGDVNHKLEINSEDEIGMLSHEFNILISSLNEARTTINQKVQEQTTDILEKTKNLEDQKKAILNILEDVETAKNESENLASNLRKFELAVNNANDHIIITDPEGIVLYANKSMEQITGFSIEEVIGKKAGNKDLWGGLMPQEFYQTLWKTIKTDQKPLLAEVKNKRKNGEIYIAKAAISPVFDEKKEIEYFVGIERDVTKEFEIDRMKTDFISLASHQLRTPLSAMRWFAEMLLHGDMGKLSDEQQEAVQNIYASNSRLIVLVNFLLNISRIESGRITVDPKPTDMTKLIQDVIEGLKKELVEKNQQIIVNVGSDLPLIALDEKMIHEVYVNLLTNAIKYSPKDTEIVISIEKKDNDVLTQISDSGYGIPLAQQNRIFQRFFRADNVVKRETDGTGLGLYLTQSIINSSKGKIWFKSEENKGTTFWFTLPITGMAPRKGNVSLS